MPAPCHRQDHSQQRGPRITRAHPWSAPAWAEEYHGVDAKRAAVAGAVLVRFGFAAEVADTAQVGDPAVEGVADGGGKRCSRACEARRGRRGDSGASGRWAGSAASEGALAGDRVGRPPLRNDLEPARRGSGCGLFRATLVAKTYG